MSRITKIDLDTSHDVVLLKVSQIFILYESVQDRNLPEVLSRVKNALSCNIFTK